MKLQADYDVKAEFPIREQYAFLNHASVAPIPLSTQTAIARFAQEQREKLVSRFAQAAGKRGERGETIFDATFGGFADSQECGAEVEG